MQLPRANQATKASCSGPTGRNSLCNLSDEPWKHRDYATWPVFNYCEATTADHRAKLQYIAELFS